MAKKVMLFLWVVMTLGLVLGDMPCAWAEDDDLDEFTLEEITVTAQKREENQQKVPIAMEVISGDQLVEQGLDNVDEILYEISNVMINTGMDGMRVTLRGISDEEATSRTCRPPSPLLP
jgi:iron complex outermembrane receptor protein